MNTAILLCSLILSTGILIMIVLMARHVRRTARRVQGIEQQCTDLLRGARDTAEYLRWLDDANVDLVRHVDRLAADIVHRELYRDKGNRQTQALEAVKAGVALEALVEEHGLSSDEAELLRAFQPRADRSEDAALSS